MQADAVGAGVIRAQALYEMALGMATDRSVPGRDFGEVRLAFGAAGALAKLPTLTVATDTPDSPYAVARGDVNLSVVNPSALLTMAFRGTGPFPEPLPLRAVAVMPSWDLMAFAIAGRTGLDSLTAVRDQRYPLRVSVRAAATHATRFVIDQALGSLGFSLADIESWGGAIQYAPSPRDSTRLSAIDDGSIDAVFDEGINGWMPRALRQGIRPVALEPVAQARMSALGWDIRIIPGARFSALGADVPAVDFSGWPMFTHENASEAAVYQMCSALDAARGRIPWDSESPVALRDICGGTLAAPLAVPLHPGAARYYAEHGAL